MSFFVHEHELRIRNRKKQVPLHTMNVVSGNDFNKCLINDREMKLLDPPRPTSLAACPLPLPMHLPVSQKYLSGKYLIQIPNTMLFYLPWSSFYTEFWLLLRDIIYFLSKPIFDVKMYIIMKAINSLSHIRYI